MIQFIQGFHRELAKGEPPSRDELKLARVAMLRRYEYSRRQIPDAYPTKPLETVFDAGAKDWRELLYVMNKASTVRERGRILVTLTPDFQHWEINDYLSSLSPTIKCQSKGHALIIESPEEFDNWLGPAPRSEGLLGRLFRRQA